MKSLIERVDRVVAAHPGGTPELTEDILRQVELWLKENGKPAAWKYSDIGSRDRAVVFRVLAEAVRGEVINR